METRMIYKVQYMAVGGTNWANAAEGNSESMMIQHARSIARGQPRREKVRVVDAKGNTIWMS
jgi:hypothetical protein